MTLPGWLYWITYISVPVLAGVVAVRGVRPARGSKALGVAVVICLFLNLFELVRMSEEMNRLGGALFTGIVVSQFGLWWVFAGERGGRVLRAVLGTLALATVASMLAVRAQIIWIFG